MMILMIILNAEFSKKNKQNMQDQRSKKSNLNLRLIKKIPAVFHNLQN